MATPAPGPLCVAFAVNVTCVKVGLLARRYMGPIITLVPEVFAEHHVVKDSGGGERLLQLSVGIGL